MGKKFISNVKGVGISSITQEFYMSDSVEELTGGKWTTEVPEVGNQKNLWTRLKIVLTNQSVIYTTGVCDGVWEKIYQINDIGSQIGVFQQRINSLTVALHALQSAFATESTTPRSVATGGTGRDNLIDFAKDIGLEVVEVKPVRNQHAAGAESYVRCVYIKALGMCFFNTSIPARQNNFDYPLEDSTLLWTIPAGYAPKKITALAVGNSGPSSPTVTIGTDGEIRITPKYKTLSHVWLVTVAGHWFV